MPTNGIQVESARNTFRGAVEVKLKVSGYDRVLIGLQKVWWGMENGFSTLTQFAEVHGRGHGAGDRGTSGRGGTG